MPDQETLRKLYDRETSAQLIFDYFADRKRGSRQTSVESLQATMKRQNQTLRRKDITDLFRQLETAGCGTFVKGAKGHASRFEWTVNLMDVGRLATGEETNVDSDGISAVEPDEADMVPHTFPLRPEMDIEILLPVDLTVTEAKRLGGFIRTLPFENE